MSRQWTLHWQQWLLCAAFGTLLAASVEPSTPPAGLSRVPQSRLSPALPETRDSIALRVVYPTPHDFVRVRDSSFLFGSVASGKVKLSINGEQVRVWPNGAWLAWLPFPYDTVMQFRIEARLGSDSAVLHYPVRRDLRYFPREVREGKAWLDSVSLSPLGQVWLPQSEYLTLSVRAVEGAQVQVRLPDQSVIRLFPQTQPEEVLPAIRAFERDTTKLRTPDEVRYVAVVRGRALGPDPGPVLGGPSSSLVKALGRAAWRCLSGAPCPVPYEQLLAPEAGWPVVQTVLGADSVRVRWPLQVALLDTLPVVVELDDDTTQGQVLTDSIVQGRAVPGGNYQWFFPTGTRAVVNGRVNQDVRIRLPPRAEAWVPIAEARPLPRGVPAPQAIAGSITVSPGRDRVVLRIPLTQRVPFHIVELERRLTLSFYGAAADVDWVRYGGDSLIERLAWNQLGPDELAFTIDLTQPVWGYRARWSRNDLLLEIRRPPLVDPSNPLRGRVIAVDPAHPPLGATGPTGLREAEANLAVALRLRDMLESAGARVVMTRTTDTAVDLWPRVALAERGEAELLVSIHNNALPDGVNPFTNNGTSVFYNQPRSLPLAAAIQRRLVRRLKLRDLGIGRGDLALIRATWMPAALCEGMFLILPEQEAALRSPAGQRRYAMGVLEGIRQFLQERAEDQVARHVGSPEPGASPRAKPSSPPSAPGESGPERGVAP